jgi:hypothetical protein
VDVKKSTRRFLWRYWGYLLLILVVAGWFYTNIGPVPLGIGSALVVMFCLFLAPMPCCAETRDGHYCRRNGTGILGGCFLKSHKWQNAKALVQRQSWAKLGKHVFTTVAGNATAISALAASGSMVIAAITLMTRSPTAPPGS